MLQELGFNVGDPVLVKCEDGKLIITPDTTKVELMEAEKAFICTGIGVFTIMEVREEKGSDTGCGRLKSGAGWISLDFTSRV